MMNVTYENKEAMTFIGYHTEIAPDEGYQKCPEFWDKEYAQKYVWLWQTMQPETPVEEAIFANNIGQFAICAESKNGFTYWIAGSCDAVFVRAGRRSKNRWYDPEQALFQPLSGTVRK